MRTRGSRLNRWPYPHSRCQTAQCSSFPRRIRASRLVSYLFISSSLHLCLFIFRIAPGRGVDGAPTGTLVFYCRACEARPPRPGATGTPLGAPPWRFSAGDPRCRFRQWDTGAAATARASRRCLAVGGPDLPRCGSRRRRGTPLPAPPSGSSPETPLTSEDANHLVQLRYVVNKYLRTVAAKAQPAAESWPNSVR
jgi:hypothetical protein